MSDFITFVFTPAGLDDVALAIAASRVGAVGIYNAELEADPQRAAAAFERLARLAHGHCGIKLDAVDDVLAAALRAQAAARGPDWLILDAALAARRADLTAELRGLGTRVVIEVTAGPQTVGPLPPCDGLLLKGNESGGFVGEDASFILLQKWLGRTELPLYLRGGLTPHVAAACSAVGVAGGVLDSQLLLLDEVRLPDALRTLIGNLAGSETVAVGQGEEGEYFRLLVRPALAAARAFVGEGDGLRLPELRRSVLGRMSWSDPAKGLLPIGQDVAFAAPWRKQYRHLGALLAAIDAAVASHPRIALERRAIAEGAPLARDLGLRYPIVQGPMTRVSDTAEFALAVACGGALPMVALALLKGPSLETLLARTAELLADRPWGIGLLGFAPQALLDEQLAAAVRVDPDYAIIAGGRPDQAVQLERAGIPTFLHVPAASLIPTFLQEGARRFIFEGRECGGHIGPLSSFVLWSTMVDRLLDELGPGKVRGEDVELLFAGGIHDAVSSAMLQVLVAPLLAAGAKVGVLMGSAYLFTEEIVATGALVPQFQREVLECERTVNLESGPGHASRCAYTPFAHGFFEQRLALRRDGVAPDESRRLLDDLILGRLLIASKGRKRAGSGGAPVALDVATQREEGMYMLGQVATLRDGVTRIEALHREVCDAAAALLERRAQTAAAPAQWLQAETPADVAIVGMASVFPKANTTREYWENILARVDAIGEIPSHRWDWRLYYDADRQARDKIYSKWGGFLDDMAFDPLKFGMPPKSIESVDPMQLMGLEVAQRTLVDAGYHERAFDRERASVIIGASGGTGDFGMQYGLRSELPRFSGELAADVAARLPEWTEDSFAGILPNVSAGRIANRLNFGGINLTTDAACASSLAAVYQGVTELIAGRSDFVIAGGIDTVQGPFGFLCFSKTQALSPRGRCSTFDADGDGIVISEGIAMVALKRLADAERDGDRIYAVIKGAGASSDGNAKGLTAPLPAGQLRAMRRAYAMAGFGAETVGLFEAHGTGTVAGDTAELESTTRLIQEAGAHPRQAVIGSVKTMIGHTKASAGIAGLVKAALALHHRVLPPHRNVTTPNRVLADPKAPLYLLDEPRPWLAPVGLPRRASCSAFGFGGTNFHVALEEYAQEYRDWLRAPASDAWSAELLLWCAPDRAALAARVDAAQARLAGLDGLALRDLAASLAARRQTGGEALAIVARDVGELRQRLAAAVAFLRGDAKALPPGVFHGDAQRPGGKTAVLFSGQGSQYPGMAREAALQFEPVADALASADRVLCDAFEQRFGAAARLSAFIYPRGAYDDAAKAAAREALTRTDVAQPALGAVEAGLWRLMQSLGLAADMFAGHSYGEFVALFAAGAFDFDALMRLSAARGRLIVDAAASGGTELGTMAAVNAERKLVEDAIVDIDGVIIANHNAPLQCIVSGTHAAVQAATDKLVQAGVEVAAIPVAAAFHSSLVRPAQRGLAELIDATAWAPTRVPVYSNSTARPHGAEPARVKRQMAEHLVQPVEFVAQVEAMYQDGARLFVEIGPKAVLARLVGRILEGRPHCVVALDEGNGLAALLGGIGQLLCAGVELDVAQLFARRDCRVGNADDPATLLRVETPARHAWMLNGSGARRVAEPVRQIGVTLEQARATAPPAPAPATPQPAPPPPEGARAIPISNPQASRGSRPMDERRTAPGAADSSVMSEYFLTMRQFLETQERVMSAFLGEAMPARPQMLRPRPAVALPRPAELAAPPTPAASVPIPVVSAVAPVAAAVPPAPPAKPAPVAQAPRRAEPEPAAPVKAQGDALTRDKLVDMLLGIVEEKTGYPRDMVGLDQNLEADLGIDSIKRIEVVGAMLQKLPAAHRDALTDSRSKLNTQSTLNGMIDLIGQAKLGGAVAVPFDVAGTGPGKADAVVDRPFRLIIRPQPEPLAPGLARSLTPGLFIVTRDRLGVAAALVAVLTGRGRECVVVETDELGSEALLEQRCQALAAAGPIAGLIHLAALGAPTLSGQEAPQRWREALLVNEKSLFLLLHALLPQLSGAAHVVAASDLGGTFGREAWAGDGLRLAAGAVGGLKSLLEERPELRVRAVDLDPRRTDVELAAELLAEVELEGGRQEVGYPAGVRTVFHTVGQDSGPDAADTAATTGLVVLATGGARGITAEVLRELALPGNTLILTGRSELAENEPAETAALADAEALRRHFVAAVRSGAQHWTPAEVERRVQALLDRREMRANIADLRAGGATVEYRAVDVTDESGVRSLVAEVVRRHGRIDGIVHGAGVIEDRLLADKTGESWSRVVETKVLGLLLLQKFVDPLRLKFFVAFSSVAGRYGNRGQSDYATANELMNRLCLALQARWGDRVAVRALCWGPWAATTHGAGMVSAEAEAGFAAKGVRLVTPAQGRHVFRAQIAPAAASPVELICGQGPWEEREAALGALRRTPRLGPLLGRDAEHMRPTGERVLHLRVDPARHAYLADHAFDGKMVLPAAVALEVLAEAARTLWPKWHVVEVREHRLLKGVEIEAVGRDLLVQVSPPPYGSSEGFEVNAALQSEAEPGRLLTHYRAIIRLEQRLPDAPAAPGRIYADRQVAPAKAYAEWLCHGPRLQLLESLPGLAPGGALAGVRGVAPADWLEGGHDEAAADGGWVFDPGLLDAAAQMAWVWARAFRDETALPARFGRVVRYTEHWPARVRMEFERVEAAEPELVRANVYFVDEQGRCVMLIEELDSIASAALNRIGGRARAAAAPAT